LAIAAGAAVLLISGGGSEEHAEIRRTASTSTGGSTVAESAEAVEGATTQSSGKSGSESEEPAEGPAALGPADRVAVLGVLREYESAYSGANLGGMATLFTADVERHGLSPGGCLTVSGKAPVLAAYRAQFAQNGPITYALLGLGPADVDLIGTSEAHVATSYSIPAANNTGAIAFDLEERGGGWRISKVDATCNPT
jgi:hypothetical protein